MATCPYIDCSWSRPLASIGLIAGLGAAIHHHQGRVRARIPPIKLLASAITSGSGGSGGREGPAAQISAGFGSLLGQWLNLKPLDRRIAVAAGMGAEILYLHDLEVEAIIPALIASIVGYTVYRSYFDFEPIFGAQPDLVPGLRHVAGCTAESCAICHRQHDLSQPATKSRQLAGAPRPLRRFHFSRHCSYATRCDRHVHPSARPRPFGMHSRCSRSKRPWCCAWWTMPGDMPAL